MDFMHEAIKLAKKNLEKNQGGPFGAVIVKEGKIIGKGTNNVTSQDDPTAHAEIQAIRAACKKLQSFDLSGCTIYTTGEPCPMCLGAIYRAHISKIYYANTQQDAAKIGFDDHFIYEEIDTTKAKRKIPMKQMEHEEALKLFNTRSHKKNKKKY